jgi:hypothetical protein
MKKRQDATLSNQSFPTVAQVTRDPQAMPQPAKKTKYPLRMLI